MPFPEAKDRCLDLDGHASHLEWRHVLVVIEVAEEALVALGVPCVGKPADEAAVRGHSGRLNYDFIIPPAALSYELTVAVV